MSLSFDVYGAHHGQIDCAISWSENGVVLGRLDFSEFEGSPHIIYIQVAEGCRRRGIATRMLADLQARYPEQEIDWGSLTDDGTALKAGLPTCTDPSVHAPAFARLARLRARLVGMEADIARRHAAGECFRAARIAYYCLERLVDDLAEDLDGLSDERVLLDLGDAVAVRDAA